MHHVEKTLVDKFVLVVDNLDYALLDSQCHRHVKHLIIKVSVIACRRCNLINILLFLAFSRAFNTMLLEDGLHSDLKRGFPVRVVLPVLFLPLQVLDLLHLVLQVPSFPFAVHFLLLVDKLEDSAEERLDKDLLNEGPLLLL